VWGPAVQTESNAKPSIKSRHEASFETRLSTDISISITPRSIHPLRPRPFSQQTRRTIVDNTTTTDQQRPALIVQAHRLLSPLSEIALANLHIRLVIGHSIATYHKTKGISPHHVDSHLGHADCYESNVYRLGRLFEPGDVLPECTRRCHPRSLSTPLMVSSSSTSSSVSCAHSQSSPSYLSFVLASADERSLQRLVSPHPRIRSFVILGFLQKLTLSGRQTRLDGARGARLCADAG
jgi:hypothetical protein